MNNKLQKLTNENNKLKNEVNNNHQLISNLIIDKNNLEKDFMHLKNKFDDYEHKLNLALNSQTKTAKNDPKFYEQKNIYNYDHQGSGGDFIKTQEISINPNLNSDQFSDLATIISLTHNLNLSYQDKWVSKFNYYNPDLFIQENHQNYERLFFDLPRLNHINNVQAEIVSYLKYTIFNDMDNFDKFATRLFSMSKILESYFYGKYYSQNNMLSDQIKGFLQVLKLTISRTNTNSLSKDLFYSRVSRATQIIESLIRSVALLIHENDHHQNKEIKTRSLNDLLIKQTPQLWIQIFDTDMRLLLKHFLIKKHYLDGDKALRNEFAHNTEWANNKIATDPIEPVAEIIVILLLVFNQIYVKRNLLEEIHLVNTIEINT